MGSISPWHLLIVALVFLLFFGSKRMPDAARSLGRSMRIFKSEVSQMQNEASKPAETAPEAVAPQQLPAAQPVVQQPAAAQPVNVEKPQV
ncbi:Sec-independent protein translocase subunit TatA [Nocardia sp. NBC_01503]|uniref:Sec-independent protein translocase subunit TatA n=1 Tax=Nocardia sp. NBC_01503 TaxID=2975997 RepID=UPI002E7C49B4|nr:Sec-independent protein translocase subunit TatA [Nocardia sp. NBC_01503]WTL31573.1 Sec-independent protein translocase subunit TatA [Nocardia sp. NBC_01503]